MAQEILEIAEWEEQALDSAPSSTSEALVDLGEVTERSLGEVKRAFPPMPYYSPEHALSASATSTTSGSAVYSAVVRVGDSSPIHEARSWSQEHATRYEALQERHKRREVVRDLLRELKPELADEFDAAVKNYKLATENLQDREAAANAMRNVLNHYKGELLARATGRSVKRRKHWPTIADKLSREPRGSSIHQGILEQEERWRELKGRLSDVTKSQQAGSDTDLATLYTELIDHLYTVLTSVRIGLE